MTGLETALPVVIETMVEPGLLDWAGVARVLSDTPARIGRVANHGRPIAVGEPANLTLLDPAARVVVDGAQQATTRRNPPFQGRTLPGRVAATCLRGRATVLGARPVADHVPGGTA